MRTLMPLSTLGTVLPLSGLASAVTVDWKRPLLWRTRRSFTALSQLALVLAILAGSSAIASATPAISFTDANFVPSGGGNYSLGYEFTPSTDLMVTDLGTYDRDGNGLATGHAVGIYLASSQSLIASTTVLENDPLIGDAPQGYFRYHALALSVQLLAGTTYRIASSTSDADGYTYGNYQNFTNNLGLTIGAGYYSGNGGGPLVVVWPNNINPNSGEIYGVNFLATPIPEPSSLTLLGFGLAAFGGKRATRRGASILPETSTRSKQ